MHLNVIKKNAYGYDIATATSDRKLLLREDEPTLLIWTWLKMSFQALVRSICNEVHLNVVEILLSYEYDRNT